MVSKPPETVLAYPKEEVLTAVAMNVAIVGDIAACSPYVDRRFRGTVTSNFRVGNQPNKKPAQQVGR
jgi:hypothetical protein